MNQNKVFKNTRKREKKKKLKRNIYLMDYGFDDNKNNNNKLLFKNKIKNLI